MLALAAVSFPHRQILQRIGGSCRQRADLRQQSARRVIQIYNPFESLDFRARFRRADARAYRRLVRPRL